MPGVAVHRIRAGRLGAGLVGKVSGARRDGARHVRGARACCARSTPAAVGRLRRLSLGADHAGGDAARPADRAARAERGARPRQPAAGAARRGASPPRSPRRRRAARADTRARIVETGNPVRPAIARRRATRLSPRRGEAARFDLLVLGGSQGARILSASRAGGAGAARPGAARAVSSSRSRRGPRIVDAVARSARRERHRGRGRDLLRRCAGAARAGAARDLPAPAPRPSPSSPPIGRPAILVPYRHAADDHQTANARAFAACGRRLGHAGERRSRRTLLAARLAALLADARRSSSAAARAARRSAGPMPPSGSPISSRAAAGGSNGRRAGGRRMRALPLDIGTIHFVGIGGIGMSGIAEILHNLGYSVQGSDIADGGNVRRLAGARHPGRDRPPRRESRRRRRSWSSPRR